MAGHHTEGLPFFSGLLHVEMNTTRMKKIYDYGVVLIMVPGSGPTTEYVTA